MSVRAVAAPSVSHTQAAATQVLCPGRDRKAREKDTETRGGEATAPRSEIGNKQKGRWRGGEGRRDDGSCTAKWR